MYTDVTDMILVSTQGITMHENELMVAFMIAWVLLCYLLSARFRQQLDEDRWPEV